MHVARLLESKNLRDVRVVERRQGLGFALEAGHPVRVHRKRLGQDLDRHIAIQPSIARLVDLSHPARAKSGDNFVRTEARSGDQAHFFSSAVQFCTILIGGAAASSTLTFRRNRPSAETAYCALELNPPTPTFPSVRRDAK